MKILTAGKNTIKISMENGKELAAALMRFQEYYESQHKDIKGKIFTTGYLKSKGASPKNNLNLYCGGHNFDALWGGYNFPDYVLAPFIKGLFDPLTEEEQDIVETLRYRMDKFYVIGVSEDYTGALDHEECHALYYLSEGYRNAVQTVLTRCDLTGLKKILRSWGYADDVLLDECHAYLSADYDWLFTEHTKEVKKYKVEISTKIHTKLRTLKEKYKKCL